MSGPIRRSAAQAVRDDIRLASGCRPWYPKSKLYRIMDDDLGIQLDLMPVIHGVRSFNSLRSRAERRELSGEPLLLASLRDIIRSKKSAARLRDAAVLPVLEQMLHEKENRPAR